MLSRFIVLLPDKCNLCYVALRKKVKGKVPEEHIVVKSGMLRPGGNIPKVGNPVALRWYDRQ